MTKSAKQITEGASTTNASVSSLAEPKHSYWLAKTVTQPPDPGGDGEFMAHFGYLLIQASEAK